MDQKPLTIKSMFMQFDQDGNDKITKEGFKETLVAMGHEIEEDDLYEKVFDSLANGNKFLLIGDFELALNEND